MEIDLKILVYEKDKTLNSILIEQLSYFLKYELCLIENETSLFKIITKKSFDVCILNLKDFEQNVSDFIKIFQDVNTNNNIIIYYQTDIEIPIFNESNIIFIKKPFKFNILLNYINGIKKNKKNDKQNIYLMKNLVFMPAQKSLFNNRTNEKEHLTEKETDLLKYLFENQNTEISKSFLLTSVWGIKENINTHTLETHLYRLKQKLNKLEPELTFSFVNQNGKYLLKNNY